MKHTLAIVLMVFGIVGCATTYDSNLAGWERGHRLTTVNGKLNTVKSRHYGYKINKNLNELTIKTDGVYRYDKNYASCNKANWVCFGKDRLVIEANKLCMSSFNSPLFSVDPPKRFEFLIANGNRDIWEYPNIIKVKCQDPAVYKAEQKIVEKYRKEQAEQLKFEVIERKKSKCREYGFKDNSDGMGLCLIELDKLAAIKNQSVQANQAQLNILQQQQAEAKRQREARALMNLGAIIGGAGTPAPSSTRSKVTTPSYPTYTSSLTVPSNQLCPMLATPVVRQVIARGNRICYYQ